MKRSTVFLILSFLIPIVYFSIHFIKSNQINEEGLVEWKEVKYINGEKNDIVFFSKKGVVQSYYKVVGQTHDHKLAVYIGTDTSKLKSLFKNGIYALGNQDLGFNFKKEFIDENTLFDSKVSLLTQAQLEDLKDQYYSECYYMSEVFNPEIPGGMGWILNSRFNYLFVALLLAVILGFLLYINRIIKSFLPKKFWLVLPILFIIRLALYVNSPMVIFVYTELPVLQWILPIIAPVGMFILFQYLLPKLKGIAFFELEFYKILIILLGGIVFTLIANYLGKFIYSLAGYSINVSNKELFEYGQLLFSFHSWVFIACSNFFVNLFNYIIRLRRQSKKVDISLLERDKSDAELSTLASRVNPHFLYNSLNSIASLSKDNPEKTEAMALALADFYRFSTNRKDEFDIPLSEELNIIDTYLKIEKIRFGDRLNVKINVEENCKSILIPRFLLQPIIENAIKYGYNDSSNSIDVIVEAYKENKTLHLKVYDGGLPFEGDLSAGYGINSIKKKLKLRFPHKSELSFNNEPRKFVAIEIILK